MSLADFKTVFSDCYTVRFMIMEKPNFSAVCEMDKFVEIILFPVCVCATTQEGYIYIYIYIYIYMNT